MAKLEHRKRAAKMRMQSSNSRRMTEGARLIGLVACTGSALVSAGSLPPARQGGSGDELRVIEKMTVIDANRKTVGEIGGAFPVSMCGGSPVPFQLGKYVFSVGVGKEGFVKCPESAFTLYYELENCEGTAFLRVETDDFVQGARVGDPGSTVYLPDLDDIRPDFHAQSSYNMGSCYPYPPEITIPYVAPQIGIIDLDETFTPPFELLTGPGKGKSKHWR